MLASTQLLPALLAAAAETVEKSAAQPTGQSFVHGLIALATVLALFIVPFFLGKWFSKRLRQPEYSFRIGLILFAMAAAATVSVAGWPPKLGPDLEGGVILTYELEDQNANREALMESLRLRLNPSGTKEIVLRPYGQQQIEIIVPRAEPAEIRKIREIIEKAGVLHFRIVANSTDHKAIQDLARKQSQSPNYRERALREVRDPTRDDNPDTTFDEQVVGFWAQVAREEKARNGVQPLKLRNFSSFLVRNTNTGQILDTSEMPVPSEKGVEIEQWLAGQGIENIDVLLATNDRYHVTGDDLRMSSSSYDEMGAPAVSFTMTNRGAQKFRRFTYENRPDNGRERQLAIMIDKELVSAPNLQETISAQGRITGRFTQSEVDFIVRILDAGKLPTALHGPTSVNQTGSLLGEETIRKGTRSIIVSLVAVLVFIAFYYRFSGIVACAALLANVLLILGFLILLKAPLTLPGLAGLVLTVGMSVDANVLIFERIREELNKGAALRMAIRNGFARARTTIIDANVTTLLTAIVLYVIGTDQIKGFAITLIIGILMSMFTAIYCSRVVFELAERKRWITELHMTQMLSATNFNFIGMRKIAAAFSLTLITIGVVAVVARGKQMLDIDFAGGSSVTMVLDESMDDADVRKKLDDVIPGLSGEGTKVDYRLVRVDVEGQDKGRYWKVSTSMDDVDALKKALEDAFPVASNGLQFGNLSEQRKVDPKQTGAEKSDTGKADAAKADAAKADAAKADAAKADAAKTDAAKADAAKADAAKADAAKADAAKADADKADADKADADKADAAKADAAKADADKADADKADAAKADADKTSALPQRPTLSTVATDAPNPQLGQLRLAMRSGASSRLRAFAQASNQPADTEKSDTEKSDTEKSDTAKSDTAKSEAADPAATPGDAATPAGAPAGEDATPAGDPLAAAEAQADLVSMYSTTAELELDFEASPTAVLAMLQEAGEAVKVPIPTAQLVVNDGDAENWTPESPTPYRKWKVTVNARQEDFALVLGALQKQLEKETVWHSAEKIGGQVAEKTQSVAIAAMISSLIGIIAYIWLRFQRVVFGLAAVLALLHDVLITLGAIALSYYLAGALSFLQVEEFKISLPVVAAFLTIVGYSLNDTIVVFDRIREVRGKSPDLTEEMANTSVNQTLSRTMLTSLTTLIVVGILYWMGGDSIHGFAFALLIGIVVGTYSSIFVATPALQWMLHRTVVAKTKAA